jgi:hypothetical protein
VLEVQVQVLEVQVQVLEVQVQVVALREQVVADLHLEAVLQLLHRLVAAAIYSHHQMHLLVEE